MAIVLSPCCRRRGVLATILSALVPPVGAAQPQPLLLAESMPARVDITRYLVSEKLDGVRAFWDGQRLWFRSGHPVPAPEAFLRRLPKEPLDGELWLGRGQFETLSGWVRKEVPVEAEWAQIRYVVFELPGHPGDFTARAAEIERRVAGAAWPPLQAARQSSVPDAAALQARLRAVVAAGGEGLMLHRADAPYVTGRSDVLLKLKPVEDAEAIVIGHVPGQGRHRGRLGALAVRRPDGAVFRIGSGFSDAQRAAPPAVGATVTYRYRGLTGQGLPRFATFWRVREGPL